MKEYPKMKISVAKDTSKKKKTPKYESSNMLDMTKNALLEGMKSQRAKREEKMNSLLKGSK